MPQFFHGFELRNGGHFLALGGGNDERIHPLRCRPWPLYGGAIPDTVATSSLRLHFRSAISFSVTERPGSFSISCFIIGAEGKYLLHQFIAMQDHFHLLNSPRESLERAMQLNKAVFLFRQKENLDAYMRVGSLASRSAGAGCVSVFRFSRVHPSECSKAWAGDESGGLSVQF